MQNLKKNIQKIEITKSTIVFTILFLIFLSLLYQVRGIILSVFIAFILMTALNPLVDSLQKIKIPRSIAIFLVMIFTLSIVSGIIAIIIPQLIYQIGIFVENLTYNYPDIHILNFQFDDQFIVSEVTKQLQLITSGIGNIFKVISSTASGLFNFLTTIVLTVYFIIERKKLERDLRSIFKNEKKEEDTKEIFEKVERRLGGWIRGELFLMLIIGLLTYFGLILLGIPFALPLAIIAGVLELIPNLGPTLSAIPGILAGLTISVPVAIGTLILYILVQQLENNFIVPFVMKKSVDLNPIITMLSLLIGAKVGGIAGAILAVPIYITAREIFLFSKKKKII